MAFLPTNIVAGQAGHVAHSNQAYELLNQMQNPASSKMINVQKPPSYVSTVAAVGDGVTDDNVALQTIFDYLKTFDGRMHWVWLPFRNAAGHSARYMTSKPLRVWSESMIVGPATIAAHPTFDWVNHPYWEDPLYKPVGNPQPGDIALMEIWNDGTARGGTSRIFIDDLTLDCVNQPGSLGLFSKMQQPGFAWKLRIDRADIGWALWGQQFDAFLPLIIDCKVGLYLGADVGGLGTYGGPGDAKFMNFYSLNIEQYVDAAVRMDCDGPNHIYSAHFELNAGGEASAATGARVIDCLQGCWTLTNSWASHPGDTNHIFVIGDKTPLPGAFRTIYAITDFRVASPNTAGKLMIDDKVRGFTRTVGLNRYIDHFRTLFQNDTNTDNDASIEYLGDEGGTVRIGGLRGSTAAPAGHSGAQLTVRANTNQDEPQVRFSGSDGVLKSGVGQKGNLFHGNYTNASRSAITVGLQIGSEIFNTDDNAPNFWDGTAWRDAMGTVT